MKHIILLITFLSVGVYSGQTQKTDAFSLVCAYSFEESLSKIKTLLTEKGITIFAEIDHSAEAREVGENLPPARLLIVGNPKIGTAIMQENTATAIALPLKILLYEDNKQTRISYQKIEPLATEYALKNTLPRLRKIDEVMMNLLGMAVR